jgi:multidrug efflux pump subunit AcrA (membrane-fusion protein)
MTITPLKYLAFLLIVFIYSCKEQLPEIQEATVKIKVQTTNLEYGYLPDNIELSGKTIYLNKSNLIAPISGYISKVNAQQGDVVRKGDVLFEIKTPEAYLTKNKGSLLSNDYGTIEVRATVNGRITILSVTNKDVFVDKGSVMCILMPSQDLKVQVNIPFEYNKWAKIGNDCKIILPDSTQINGHLSKYLPQIDPSSQTVQILASVTTQRFLPENMIVKVLLDKSTKHNAQIINKNCLQTDALMKSFWLMKLINDSTAVPVYVTIGNQNHNKVEILSPIFKPNDVFISEGVYGLSDTVLIDAN